jgi:hypothetical protein
MNALVDDILGLLRTNALVRNTRIVHFDETPAGKLEVKIRCQLPKSHQLQIWIHVEPEFQDYAYQVFTTIPILRWDNAPHYNHLSTAPHHFHDERGKVSKSPLTGSIAQDLRAVLQEIADWMKS